MMHFQDSPRLYFCGLDKIISLIVLVVIMGANFPSCESHLASLIKTGDGILSVKGPSFITSRVSRDPSGTQNDMEDTDLDLNPSSRFHFLKPPTFQTKLRPNRLSTFHHYIHGPNLNKNRARSNNIISNNNLGEDPSIFPSYRSNRDDEDEGKIFETTTTTGGDSESGTDLLNESSESPTFTPFISAQALTNMEKFFSNLQANIMAMHDGNLEIGQPERRKASDQVLVKTQESSLEPQAMFQALRWVPPASGLARENNGPAVPPPLSSSSSSVSSSSGGRNRMNFIDEDDERRRAKGYNPRMLWTNMGLG